MNSKIALITCLCALAMPIGAQAQTLTSGKLTIMQASGQETLVIVEGTCHITFVGDTMTIAYGDERLALPIEGVKGYRFDEVVSGINHVLAQGTPDRVYTLDGREVQRSQMRRGTVYIINNNGKLKKIILK